MRYCWKVFIHLVLLTMSIQVSAGEYDVDTPQGEFEARTYPSHIELIDQAGNTILISATPNGLVEIEKFFASGGYSSSVHDADSVSIPPGSEAALQSLLSDITVTSAHDGGGPGDTIIYGLGKPGVRVPGTDPSIQGWGCFGATVGLVAAAGAVYLACSGPQAALACHAALGNYFAASVNYWTSCGYMEEE